MLTAKQSAISESSVQYQLIVLYLLLYTMLQWWEICICICCITHCTMQCTLHWLDLCICLWIIICICICIFCFCISCIGGTFGDNWLIWRCGSGRQMLLIRGGGPRSPNTPSQISLLPHKLQKLSDWVRFIIQWNVFFRRNLGFCPNWLVSKIPRKMSRLLLQRGLSRSYFCLRCK